MKEWKGQMVEVLSCGFLVGQCIPEIDGLVIVTKFDMHFANYARVVFFRDSGLGEVEYALFMMQFVCYWKLKTISPD